MKRIPPPIFYITFILLGILTGKLIPLSFMPGQWSMPVGAGLVLISFGLVGLVFREFGKAKTGFDSQDKVTALLTSGPFAFSRNPMYLSATILQLGLGIWLDNDWLLVLLIPVLILVMRFAIQPEEVFLSQRFGAKYDEYRASVRRWI